MAGIDIFDEKYAYASGSKANRLRAFWTEENDEMLTPVLVALIEWVGDAGEADPNKLESARQIVDRLKGGPLSKSQGVSMPRPGGAEVCHQSVDKS